jgi:hypothetical protein
MGGHAPTFQVLEKRADKFPRFGQGVSERGGLNVKSEGDPSVRNMILGRKGSMIGRTREKKSAETKNSYKRTIAMKRTTGLIAFTACMAFAMSAHAQSYTIQKPGELPTYVRPSPGGGSTITRPGQLPIYVRPSPGGGATINTPGKLPTYVRPSPGGGSTITRPGQLPTYVRLSPGGGATINTPGELPTYVRPSPGGGYTVQKPGELPVFIRKSP